MWFYCVLYNFSTKLGKLFIMFAKSKLGQSFYSLNPLKLWLPQIFQAISDYQFYHNGTSASLCTMLEDLHPINTTNKICIVVSTNK